MNLLEKYGIIDLKSKYDKVVSFTSSRSEYGWMGNMCGYYKDTPLKIMWEGKEWKTSENVFQAMRFNDEMIREKIRRGNGKGGKMVAKSSENIGKMVVEPLSEEDVMNMLKVVKMKVEQNKVIKDSLLELPKNVLIIEDVSSRRGGSGLFWGAAKISKDMWSGYNILGKIWMEVRKMYD